MATDTLGRMFWDRVERSGDRPAQQSKHGTDWKTITWREVGDIVREVALGLLALGRGKGDAVALLSTSRAEWVQADFAIFSAGCVTVPVYPTYPPDLIAYVVNDSGAKTIIVEDPGQLAKVLEARDKTPGLEQIVVMSGYDAPQPPKMVMTWETLRRLGRESLDAQGSTLAERVASTRPTDLATIVYTSGTTGPPKGVMQTHGNHVAAVTASKPATPVPEGWGHLLSAPLAPDIAEFFHAAGILLLEGYGLTETCPALTFNRPDRFKFGSVGQTLPGVQLRIAADGEILARGPNIATLGYFKQPEATREVFDPDGWFHTGDIGTIDGDGFLFITDRKKDLIVTAGGMNIAPQNIENLLKADPFISQVMIYGDRRPYPVALITVNPDELSKFAREQGILASETAVIVKHPKVVERIGRTVEEKNTQLQSYAKIKRFRVLATDFTLDGGELTPTLKVKRTVVSQKYRDAIEELYR